MTYWICEANSAEKLRTQVQDSIAKGWRPIGGLAVVHSNSTADWWYFQAMVLDSPEERAEAYGDPELA
jgi:hypothetical protein